MLRMAFQGIECTAGGTSGDVFSAIFRCVPGDLDPCCRKVLYCLTAFRAKRARSISRKSQLLGLLCTHLNPKIPISNMSKNKNQEIEENELADWFQKYFDEWKPYMPIVIAGTVIVIAAIIGGTWWYQNRVNSEARIWQELSQARFNAMKMSSRPDEDVSTVGLTDFADTYGDTAAGKWATLQAGVLELDRGLSILNQQLSVKSEQEKADKNIKRAIAHFGKILDDQGEVDQALMRRAIFKMAVAQEATGQLAEAKKYYEQAIEFAG